MKFITAQDIRGSFVGIMNDAGDKVLPLRSTEQRMSGTVSFPATMIECISLGEQFIGKTKALISWVADNHAENDFYIPISDVTLLAPIPRPAKNIFCVGKNYVDHAIELGSKDDIPEHLIVFTKAPTTVIGANAMIPTHQEVSSELDYEGELAVVIGKQGTAIKQEDALKFVFGYTIINDVTARDLQIRHKQYFIGKSLDGTCPMGPWIVHSSAISNPNKLNIETKVNGEIRQSSNTGNFIFSIEKIIAELSKGMTLEPGDVIATGTPAGVGKGFKPPRMLKKGDRIEITVESVGNLVNTVGE